MSVNSENSNSKIWDTHEDSTLLFLAELYDKKWKKISIEFKNLIGIKRTINSCRIRYRRLNNNVKFHARLKTCKICKNKIHDNHLCL